MQEKIHTLIISDLHLGCKVSSPKEILQLLESISYDRLILLGDILDKPTLESLNRAEKELISYFIETSKDKEVVWIAGNHDREFKEREQFPDIIFLEEFSWEHEGKNYLVIHGDQFYAQFNSTSRISAFSRTIDKTLLAFNLKTKFIMKALGPVYRRTTGMTNKVAKGALIYAEQKDADYILCGHTHKAFSTKKTNKNNRNTTYINTGSWAQRPATYVTINSSGPELRKYKKQTSH